MGATGAGDGQNALAWPSNVSNVPVELIERNAPMLIRKKELRPDSGGRGRNRGGLGQEIVFEVTSETPVGMIFMAERCRIAAPGVGGGAAGARGEITIDGEAIDHRRNVVLTKGQVVRLATPGGGGFGDEMERPAAAAAHDAAEGYTGQRQTRSRARDV